MRCCLIPCVTCSASVWERQGVDDSLYLLRELRIHALAPFQLATYLPQASRVMRSRLHTGVPVLACPRSANRLVWGSSSRSGEWRGVQSGGWAASGMDKWEYLATRIAGEDFQDTLNQPGDQGREVVNVERTEGDCS